MKTFLKYLPLIITVVGAASPMFSPSVDAFWQAHPQTVAAVAGFWAAFKWLLPSPIKNG